MQWITRRRTNEVQGKADPFYTEFKNYQSALSDGFEGTMDDYTVQTLEQDPRSGYQGGQLVDHGPGRQGYNGEPKLNNQGWVLPRAPKGKIHQKELIEMLTKATGKKFKRSQLSSNPGKKDYLVNKIGELLNRTTGKSKGKSVYYLFDKPTVAQLDFIGEFIDAPHLMDRTVRNINILDKEFGKMIADAKGKGFFRNELTIDRVKDAFKKAGVQDITDSKAALAMTRYGQSLQGKLFKNVEGITKNTKVGDFIFESFNELNQYHPWRQGSYQAVLDDINRNMGNKAGKLGNFKTAFKEKMQKLYPNRDFVFNEVFSISTSANRGAYPYAYFVDLTEHSMNSGALSSFQGQASVFEGKIQEAVGKYRKTGNLKFHKEAQDLAKTFNNTIRKKFLSSEKVLKYEKDYGVKPNALKLEVGSQGQVKDKLNFAKDYYSNKNLEKWRNLGIDIDAHTGKSGYIKTFGGKGVPKNVITAGELFTEDTRLGKGKKIIDEKAFETWIKKFPCRRSNGGAVDIDCHIESMKREKNLLTSGKGSRVIANKFIEGTSLARKGKLGLNLTRGFFGMGGVLGEALFEGGYAAYNYTQGKDAADIWKNSWLSFADRNLWKDGKYIGWVSDAEQAKLYTRKDGSIMPEIKRYVDNANKVQKLFDLQDNVFSASQSNPTLQVGGEQESKKALFKAKKELSDFNTRMNLEGGEGKVESALERDSKAFSEREEVIAGREQNAKKATFEEMRAKGWFPKDKEFTDLISDVKIDRKNEQAYTAMEAANPAKSIFSSPEAMADYFVDDNMAQEYIKENHPLHYGHVSSKRILPAIKQKMFGLLRQNPKYNEFILSSASENDPTLKGTQYNQGGKVEYDKSLPDIFEEDK